MRDESKQFFETTKDVSRILQNLMLANGDENLAAYLESVNVIEPIPDAFFNPLFTRLSKKAQEPVNMRMLCSGW